MVPLLTHSCFILKLPSEILQNIIDLSSMIEKENEYNYIHGWSYPEHSYVDLKNIALCCRQFYILVAPFLWKDKEFILPRKDDEKGDVMIQMATDILSKKALFQQQCYLGDYVRSLNRDLTSGPHYNLNNTKWMAQLVLNLKALRIDFHPHSRKEEYGLRYFAEYCTNLTELYLSRCYDTFDDFYSLYQYKPPLNSLTLIECTIKETTLDLLSKNISLDYLLLQHVFIEPKLFTLSINIHLLDINQHVHPFHYQNTKSTVISSHIYQSLFTHQHLTQLALSDPISQELLFTVVNGSPQLQKLAIVLNELIPIKVLKCIQSIGTLSKLSILSLAFRKMDPISKESEKLPCHLPSLYWNQFMKQLPLLKSLYISTTRILLNQDFITHLPNIIIHNIALVTISHDHTTKENDEESVLELYLKEVDHLSCNIQDWNRKNDVYTFEQAKEKGFQCFDEGDQVCFIRGFQGIPF